MANKSSQDKWKQKCAVGSEQMHYTVSPNGVSEQTFQSWFVSFLLGSIIFSLPCYIMMPFCELIRLCTSLHPLHLHSLYASLLPSYKGVWRCLLLLPLHNYFVLLCLLLCRWSGNNGCRGRKDPALTVRHWPFSLPLAPASITKKLSLCSCCGPSSTCCLWMHTRTKFLQVTVDLLMMMMAPEWAKEKITVDH